MLWGDNELFRETQTGEDDILLDLCTKPFFMPVYFLTRGCAHALFSFFHDIVGKKALSRLIDSTLSGRCGIPSPKLCEEEADC